MSLHASLVLARGDAQRLLEVFNRTGNFPDAAESLDLVLKASSTKPSIAIITTTTRVGQITEWLKQHPGSSGGEFDSIFEALRHALDFPFYEEHYNTSSSV